MRHTKGDRLQEPDGILLGDLRQRLGVRQQQLADVLGTTQPSVLKTERSSDPQLSSIRRYVEALGHQAGRDATLEVNALVGDDRVLLRFPPPEEPERVVTAGSPTDPRTCWRLRVWNEELEERFLTENRIAISDDDIGDLTDWPSSTEVRSRLRTVPSFSKKTEQAIGLFVSYWTAFRVEMQPDDVVVVPLTGRRAAIGVIDGPYRYRADEVDSKMRHVRDVRWVRVVDRSGLDEPVRKVVNAPGTICRVQAPGAAQRLVPLAAPNQAAT
jgi:transcriptional regulator with XRE-family HTH domain